jgi:hypothetical protein
LITFGDGAEQRAAVWIWPNRRSAWMRQQLPDAGTHSEALSSACAQTCWVAGHADGNVALWRFDPASAAGSATRNSSLPSLEIDTDGPGPRTILSGDRPGIVFSHAGSTQMALSDGHDGWQIFTAPSGSVLDATTVGERLHAIIRSDDGVGLWTADLQQSTEVVRAGPDVCGLGLPKPANAHFDKLSAHCKVTAHSKLSADPSSGSFEGCESA